MRLLSKNENGEWVTLKPTKEEMIAAKEAELLAMYKELEALKQTQG